MTGVDDGRVAALGYLGLTSPDLGAWERMSTTLGVATELVGDTLLGAVDERAWRLHVQPGATDDLAFVGWELRSGADLDVLRARIAASGHDIGDIDEGRQIVQGFSTRDPDGNTLELFVGAAVPARRPAEPAARFRTGALGLGHVVLHCHRFEEMLDFYVTVLGFTVSDTYGQGGVDVAFLHCNSRHHSLALVRGRGDFALQHLMLEVETIDEVGRCYDACLPLGLAQSTLGRHTNDRMLSFYVLAPGGFTIEYGADGRLVEQPELQPHHRRTSVWGHHDLVASR
jgi:2,3-dihydroxybiphenyl 1,2-dioxygenase